MAEKKAPVRGMAELNKELSDGQIRNLYVLYGSERYLLLQYRDILIKKLVPEGDTMNFTSYSGSNIKMDNLLDDLRTMPFLAERRVVLVEGSGFFTKSMDELIDGLEHIADTTVLIFVEPDIVLKSGTSSGVDKRGRLYKLFDKAGGAFCFDTPSEATLVTWITGRLSETGKKIERQVPQKLIDTVGLDMQLLSLETEKLISYTIERDAIRVTDVEAISSTMVEDKVFAMVDAIANKKQDTALSLYNDLVSLREHPSKILALITRHYQLLLQFKQMLKDNTSREDMVRITKVRSFTLKQYLPEAKAYSMEQLLSANDACLDAAHASRTGKLSEENALERLIIDLLAKA